jgi:multiple sugar transport system permease protein
MKKKNLTGFLFASPWIIGFILFSVYPISASLYYSLTNFNLFKTPIFVGLDNYRYLFFQDDRFWKSLYNTLYMTVFGTSVFLFVSLAMALMLNMKVRTQSLYRTLFYIPTVMPMVATTMLWLWILNPRFGLANSALKFLGLPQPNWFSDPALTKPSLIIIGAWATGNIMIFFLAALQEVPISLYESAEIDGAGAFRKFFRITLPWIAPTMLYQLIVNFIYNFQYFTQAYVMLTGSSGEGTSSYRMGYGGPENSLLFYALYLYHRGFVFFKMGEASAMAWILFVIVVIVTIIIFRTSKRWVEYGGE